MHNNAQNSYWRQDTENPIQEITTITLWPYRSLGPRGYIIIIAGFSGLAFLLSLLFYHLGAWPVMGFLGVEIGIVWLAFRMNYNSGRNFEQIFVTKDTVRIERVHWGGKKDIFEIKSAWSQAICLEPSAYKQKLVLQYHAEQFEIGAFLPPQEKQPLANALNASFQRMSNGA